MHENKGDLATAVITGHSGPPPVRRSCGRIVKVQETAPEKEAKVHTRLTQAACNFLSAKEPVQEVDL